MVDVVRLEDGALLLEVEEVTYGWIAKRER
jgi:hypothetical protein